MFANPTLSRQLSLPRLSGWGQAISTAAMAVVWIHLLDAAFVHPQAGANAFEHAAQAVLAVVAIPAGVLVYPHLGRALNGAVALVVGTVAATTGFAIHVVGVIKYGEWVRSDYTGVPMAMAGVALIVFGMAALTVAIPRWRYRWLMAPASVAGLLYFAFPLGMATYVTHAPRPNIEPQDLGAAYEEVEFETSDGLTLRGWYVASRNGAAVAVIHGSGGSRLGTVEHARMLVRNGYGVLLFDVRGHGESDGATNALGWGTYKDYSAAADYLYARPDVVPGQTGVLGLSMGAEIAIEWAANDDGFAAVVADGASGRTFADLRQYSFDLPTRAFWSPPLQSAELMEWALSGTKPPRPLVDLAPDIREPMLYISADGVEEELISRIAQRSGGQSELWVVPGAGHTQGLKLHPALYEARVVGFFDRELLGQ